MRHLVQQPVDGARKNARGEGRGGTSAGGRPAGAAGGACHVRFSDAALNAAPRATARRRCSQKCTGRGTIALSQKTVPRPGAQLRRVVISCVTGSASKRGGRPHPDERQARRRIVPVGGRHAHDGTHSRRGMPHSGPATMRRGASALWEAVSVLGGGVRDHHWRRSHIHPVATRGHAGARKKTPDPRMGWAGARSTRPDASGDAGRTTFRTPPSLTRSPRRPKDP